MNSYGMLGVALIVLASTGFLPFYVVIPAFIVVSLSSWSELGFHRDISVIAAILLLESSVNIEAQEENEE